MGKIFFSVLLVIGLLTNVAHAECVKGSFEVQLDGLSFQGRKVESASAKFNFELETDTKNTGQFRAVLANADEQVKTSAGMVAMSSLVSNDDLPMIRAAVRCPCEVYQSNDGKVVLEFASLQGLNVIQRMKYFGHAVKPSDLTLSATCQ